MRQQGARTTSLFRFAFAGLAALGLAGASAGQTTPPPTPPRMATPATHPARTFVWKSMGRGYLGVQVLPLTRELRTHFGAPEDSGVLVARVDEGSPAAAAGIQVGDVLTAVDGEPVEGPPSLAMAIRKKKAGESVDVDFLRDGSALSAAVSVEERDRKVIDLAEIQVPLPPIAPFAGVGPLEGEHGFVFSPGGRLELDEDALRAFEEAMRDLEGRFESEEWQEKLKRFREMDLGKIQERMKEVEERLRKLESELEQEGEGKKKL